MRKAWNQTKTGAVLMLWASLFASAPSQASEPLQPKVLPGFQFFYSKQELPFTELQAKSEGIAQKIAITVARETKTEYYGAFTYLMDNLEQTSAQKITTRMGWPVRAAVPATGAYESEALPDFKCVTRIFEGEQQKLHQAWIDLYEHAAQQGLKPTGQGRTQIKLHSRGYVVAELQLGVK